MRRILSICRLERRSGISVLCCKWNSWKSRSIAFLMATCEFVKFFIGYYYLFVKTMDWQSAFSINWGWQSTGDYNKISMIIIIFFPQIGYGRRSERAGCRHNWSGVRQNWLGCLQKTKFLLTILTRFSTLIGLIVYRWIERMNGSLQRIRLIITIYSYAGTVPLVGVAMHRSTYWCFL